jgi:hypothetical protein
MKQATADSDNFMAVVIGPLLAPLPERWTGVRDLPPLVTRTIYDLAACRSAIEFFPQHDPALLLRHDQHAILYRTYSRQVYNTGLARQDPATLSLLAAHLLLANKGAFPPAYSQLLSGLATGSPQSALNALMSAAGKALLASYKTDLDQASDFIVWFFGVRPIDLTVLPELTARDGLKIARLLGDPDEYAAYLAGKSTAFGSVKVK